MKWTRHCSKPARLNACWDWKEECEWTEERIHSVWLLVKFNFDGIWSTWQGTLEVSGRSISDCIVDSLVIENGYSSGIGDSFSDVDSRSDLCWLVMVDVTRRNRCFQRPRRSALHLYLYNWEWGQFSKTALQTTGQQRLEWPLCRRWRVRWTLPPWRSGGPLLVSVGFSWWKIWEAWQASRVLIYKERTKLF